MAPPWQGDEGTPEPCSAARGQKPEGDLLPHFLYRGCRPRLWALPSVSRQSPGPPRPRAGAEPGLTLGPGRCDLGWKWGGLTLSARRRGRGSSQNSGVFGFQGPGGSPSCPSPRPSSGPHGAFGAGPAQPGVRVPAGRGLGHRAAGARQPLRVRNGGSAGAPCGAGAGAAGGGGGGGAPRAKGGRGHGRPGPEETPAGAAERERGRPRAAAGRAAGRAAPAAAAEASDRPAAGPAPRAETGAAAAGAGGGGVAGAAAETPAGERGAPRQAGRRAGPAAGSASEGSAGPGRGRGSARGARGGECGPSRFSPARGWERARPPAPLPAVRQLVPAQPSSPRGGGEGRRRGWRAGSRAEPRGPGKADGFSREEVSQILQERNELKANVFLLQEELEYYHRELLAERRVPRLLLSAMKSAVRKQRRKIKAKMLGTAEEPGSSEGEEEEEEEEDGDEETSWLPPSDVDGAGPPAPPESRIRSFFSLWYRGSPEPSAELSPTGEPPCSQGELKAEEEPPPAPPEPSGTTL